MVFNFGRNISAQVEEWKVKGQGQKVNDLKLLKSIMDLGMSLIRIQVMFDYHFDEC